MPIQQLPRYILLLNDLIAKTEPSHPDYVELQSAVDKLKKLTFFINECKRNAETVLSIQERVIGFGEWEASKRPDIKRAFVKEGAIVEMKSGKHRYLFLFTGKAGSLNSLNRSPYYSRRSFDEATRQTTQ